VKAFNGGSCDVFAAKLNRDGGVTWNTFLGGSGADGAPSIVVDNLGNVVVAGYSTAAWGTSPLRPFGGNYDVFVSKLTWPILTAGQPGYGLANSNIAISAQGVNLTSITGVQLKNASQIVNGSNLQITGGTALTAQFHPPSPGVFDLVINTSDYQCAYKAKLTSLSPVVSPVQWRFFDLGKAGNPSSPGPSAIVVGDGDRDGLAEVYVTDNDDMVFRFKKTDIWNITYLPEMTGVNFTDLLFTDTDMDGQQKIFAACSQPMVNKYKYQPAGINWSTDGICPISGPLASGNGNHDGLADVYGTSTDASGSMSIVQALSNSPVAANLGTILCMAVGDGDNDLKDEIYVANSVGRIYQLKYNGTGWTESTVYAGSTSFEKMVLRDLDHDGKNELYSASSDKNIYQFKWTGSLWEKISIGALPGACQALAIGDGDNDGNDEIYVACADGHAYQLRLSGSAWQQQDLGNAGSPLNAIAVGDGDNDFRLEVYAVAENGHVCQFQAASAATPTATSTTTATATITPTPTVLATFTVTSTLTNPGQYFHLLHTQINPNRGELARIRWTQPEDGPVNIKIYNLLGDKVAVLADGGRYSAGEYQELTWNGRTSSGSVAGSGIYIVDFQAGSFKARGKIAVIK
jgi:hypothetical protein